MTIIFLSVDNLQFQTIATDRIGKPLYAITDGWNTDYINFMGAGQWIRESDYFQITAQDKAKISQFFNSLWV